MLKIKNIRKIAIIGGPGTGKTTLATILSNALSIHSYSLDPIKFSNNWKKKSKSEVEKQINFILKEKTWIIEGNTLTYLKKIVDKADLIIFLDYPLFFQLKGIFHRFWKCCIKEEKTIFYCHQKVSFRFLCKTIFFNPMKRPKILKVLDGKKTITILKDPIQVHQWLSKIKKE